MLNLKTQRNTADTATLTELQHQVQTIASFLTSKGKSPVQTVLSSMLFSFNITAH